MSKLYLRNTDTYTGYVATEKSAALTPTTALNNRRDLSETKGSSQTFFSFNSIASTAAQQQYIGKWISPPLTVTSIPDTDTWTFAFGSAEGSTNANSKVALSVYVLKADDTVRGYVYDLATGLGSEWNASEDGRLLTFTPSSVAVTGIVNTDRLVVEVWRVCPLQGMATAYAQTFYFDGIIDPTEFGATNDHASYLSTPQDMFAGPAILSASSTGAGTLSGSAAATANLAATAAGPTTASGTGAASMVLSAAASGAGTTGGMAAAGTLIAVTASGAGTCGGSAAATLTAGGQTLAATSTGAGTSGGAAAATMLQQVATIGASTDMGRAAGSLRMVASASGVTVSAGSAAANLVSGAQTYPATAAGAAVCSGSAVAALQMAVTAQALTALAGMAVASMTLMAGAAGVGTPSGTASATIPGVPAPYEPIRIGLDAGTTSAGGVDGTTSAGVLAGATSITGGVE